MNWIKDVIDWCLIHKEFVMDVIIVICGLIGFIFFGKRKPTLNEIDTILSDIYEILPGFISKVEKPGNGSTKKNMVLRLVQKYVFQKYHFTEFSKIEEQVSTQIENVLSAPQKKEDK